MVADGLIQLRTVVAAGRPMVIDSVIIDSSGGRDHHRAKPLRIEPGATQDRRHDVIVQQLVEGRLIAAAIGASGHGTLPTCETLCRMAGKRVLIVTRDRRFRGNLTISATSLPFRWNRRLGLPGRLPGCPRQRPDIRVPVPDNVMAGLVPAIHRCRRLRHARGGRVDVRNKSGHDENSH